MTTIDRIANSTTMCCMVTMDSTGIMITSDTTHMLLRQSLRAAAVVVVVVAVLLRRLTFGRRCLAILLHDSQQGAAAPAARWGCCMGCSFHFQYSCSHLTASLPFFPLPLVSRAITALLHRQYTVAKLLAAAARWAAACTVFSTAALSPCLASFVRRCYHCRCGFVFPLFDDLLVLTK